ncbi:MAG: S8 family serine peptidase [Candidatus Sericytochromatia bacterium]|uniref:S8 family serine peptidase n=1 Tax=Candidatus Tanganyikabacteria bacterium TaxID=2961651 RepID=A0A938BP11_9BACT|nr:S8 family serine peptidase [Candidatus Tanganyikabacteria bacterium]
MPVTIADSLTVVKSPDLPTFRTPELTVTPADRPARTGRSARKVVVPMRRWSWNLRQVGAPGAWDTTMGDPQVTVAVIDTGIDIHHPDLRGKVLSGADVVNPGAGWVDDLGHGTAVAGVIGSRGWRIPGLAGVAPGCRLLPIKCNIHGTTHVRAEHIAAGIRTAIARGAHVINLSVGVV